MGKFNSLIPPLLKPRHYLKHDLPKGAFRRTRKIEDLWLNKVTKALDKVKQGQMSWDEYYKLPAVRNMKSLSILNQIYMVKKTAHVAAELLKKNRLIKGVVRDVKNSPAPVAATLLIPILLSSDEFMSSVSDLMSETEKKDWSKFKANITGWKGYYDIDWSSYGSDKNKFQKKSRISSVQDYEEQLLSGGEGAAFGIDAPDPADAFLDSVKKAGGIGTFPSKPNPADDPEAVKRHSKKDFSSIETAAGRILAERNATGTNQYTATPRSSILEQQRERVRAKTRVTNGSIIRDSIPQVSPIQQQQNVTNGSLVRPMQQLPQPSQPKAAPGLLDAHRQRVAAVSGMPARPYARNDAMYNQVKELQSMQAASQARQLGDIQSIADSTADWGSEDETNF